MSLQRQRREKLLARRDGGNLATASGSSPPRPTRLLPLLNTGGALLLCMLLLAPASAQSTPQPPPENSDLTEGLLDLLKQPTPDPAAKSQSQPAAPELTPADVGLDGEDLGENSANPLESVRQSMLIAAGMLQQGATDTPTQQLQTGIVQRLDELIARLEQNQPQPKPAPSPSSPSEQADQSDQAPSGQTGQSAQQESPDAEEMAETRPNAQSPGQEGVAADAVVDLADPKALQQNVWGHLPERMRTQMQSRMVEQFLPSYREQIEAYFKALLEQQ